MLNSNEYRLRPFAGRVKLLDLIADAELHHSKAEYRSHRAAEMREVAR